MVSNQSIFHDPTLTISSSLGSSCINYDGSDTTSGIHIRGGRRLQSMYIHLGNPKRTSVLLKGASTRLSFPSYNQVPKWPDHPRGTHPMRPAPRIGDGFPPHKFYHGHSPSKKQPLEWPEKHFGERFAHLSCKTVLSFTINCNSGPVMCLVPSNLPQRYQ